ncbi:unnamed protein product [Calypogeia fissa]
MPFLMWRMLLHQAVTMAAETTCASTSLAGQAVDLSSNALVGKVNVGTMLTPVIATATQPGSPLTQTPSPRTIAVTLKQNGMMSLVQIILTKHHSRARKTRKCIFGRRGSPEHLS